MLESRRLGRTSGYIWNIETSASNAPDECAPFSHHSVQFEMSQGKHSLHVWPMVVVFIGIIIMISGSKLPGG